MVPEPKHIAKEFMLGGTKVRIATDYVVTDPKEIQAILDRCAAIALPYLIKAQKENSEISG